MPPAVRLCWLAPDDHGGGVASAVEACCLQAHRAGADAGLLLALPPTGHVGKSGEIRLASLGAVKPYADIPHRVVAWLAQHPQEILILNGCEQADVAIPYLPQTTRVVYTVHDTAARYYRAALREEGYLDAIVAVSETVAARFRHRLKSPEKLRVLHNGSDFPIPLVELRNRLRTSDLIFLGGDNVTKGARDVLTLWRRLTAKGFQARLHWFGQVTDLFRAEIAALPSANRIVVRGRVSRSEIFETASRAKVLLMLSRVEPFGMATVEAMGMGCVPVAWSIATGTTEIVVDGEGEFAPLGSFSALAAAVIRATDRRQDQILAMATRIRADFGQQTMWRRYQALFDELLLKPGVERPLAGRMPPAYRPTFRLFQAAPRWMRTAIRNAVGHSARLGYFVRDLRGL